MATTCFPPDTINSVTMRWKQKNTFSFLTDVNSPNLFGKDFSLSASPFISFFIYNKSLILFEWQCAGFRWHHLASPAALCAHMTESFPMRCNERVVWDFWEVPHVSGHLSYNMGGALSVILGPQDALTNGMLHGGVEREKKPGSLVTMVPALPAWLNFFYSREQNLLWLRHYFDFCYV